MQKLRATEIYANEVIRVVLIEAIHCNAEKSGRFYRLYGHVEPTAMVVCEAGDKRVVNLAPVETSLDALKRNVPGLRVLLGED